MSLCFELRTKKDGFILFSVQNYLQFEIMYSTTLQAQRSHLMEVSDFQKNYRYPSSKGITAYNHTRIVSWYFNPMSIVTFYKRRVNLIVASRLFFQLSSASRTRQNVILYMYAPVMKPEIVYKREQIISIYILKYTNSTQVSPNKSLKLLVRQTVT